MLLRCKAELNKRVRVIQYLAIDETRAILENKNAEQYWKTAPAIVTFY